MSQIDELIKDLCPDGVEYFAVSELFDLRNGYTPSKSNSTFWEDGSVPWFRMEDIRENGRILDNSLQKISDSAVKGGKLFPANSILVATSATIGEHALITVPHLSNQRFTSLSLKPAFSSRLTMRFAYYYGFVLGEWCRKNTTTSSFASVDMVGFKRFKFPVPPLEVQRVIVDILDQFVELEAELEARKQQYEFYREQLLTFDSKTLGQSWIADLCLDDVSYRELQEVATYTKDRVDSAELDETNFVGVDNLLANKGGRVDAQYSPNTARLAAFKPGDSLLGNIRPYLQKVWLADRRGGCSGDVLAIGLLKKYVGKLSPDFLYYLLSSDDFFAYNMRHAKGAKMPRGSKDAIMKYRIPIPPLEVQQRIVDILDKFDALVNDLSSGLPAEIVARRKQYEYYRDKLLTFKELAS